MYSHVNGCELFSDKADASVAPGCSITKDLGEFGFGVSAWYVYVSEGRSAF